MEPVSCKAKLGVDEQISFVLAHPAMSAWLKDALSSALKVDPISILNDLEILNLIMRQRSERIIAGHYRYEK